MKLFQSFILAFVCCVFSTFCSASDVYQLDPNHTYVLWSVNHFGFSHPSGKWLANGTITLDEKKPQDSKLDVTINLAELATGIPAFDKHIKSKEFLDTAQFATATYKSNKIILEGKDKAKVEGTLTFHGIAKPVTLNVKLNKKGINPITQKETLGFTATATLKRTDFGVGAYAPNVSDEVKLMIEAEASKDKA